MKKYLLVLAFSLFAVGAYSQNSDLSEINLSNEIKNYYSAEYYPGVIEAVNQLEKEFPESIFILDSQIAKADSLLKTGRYDESQKLFLQLLPKIAPDSEDFIRCNYLLAQSYYYSKQDVLALNSFYTVCQIANQNAYYDQSVLFAGRILYRQQKYENACQLLEYVISNGPKYSSKEYNDSVLMLFHSYRVLGQNLKIAKLYSQYKPEDFPPEVYAELTQYADQSEKNEADLLITSIQNIKSDLLAGKSVVIAEQQLAVYEERVNASNVENIQDLYNSLILYCKAKQEKWPEIYSVYAKMQNPDTSSKKIMATAFYTEEKYDQALELAKDFTDKEGKNLYGNILVQQKKYKQAEQFLSKLDKDGILSNENKLELAKVYFELKNFNKAAQYARQAKLPLSEYIVGISCINLAQWEIAYNSLTQYLNTYAKFNGYWDYASYYQAYAAYKLGDYKKSLQLFDSYEKKSGNENLKLDAYELGAKSALLQGDFVAAEVQAENLFNNSKGIEQRQSSAEFLAQIYKDDKKYQKAIAVLQPFTNNKSDFAIVALNHIALIYEEQGKIQLAEDSYNRIYTEYPESDQAEQALYRKAEIYYTKADYKNSAERFSTYLYEYPNGKYIADAYYFSGDCYLRLKDYSHCVMLNKILVSKYPDSVYVYGSYKNLLQSYYELENYGEALSVARALTRNYSEQAASDGIGTKVVELERITSGSDRKLVETESEYERNGKTATLKGRIAGSQLVQHYAKNDKQEDAFILALTILPFQKEDADVPYAAANADFVANHYKNYNDYEKASELYLKAAGYYRAINNGEKAASMLYSAVESFMALEMRGDALETAKLLKQLYPESKQAARVDALLR